ncbi:hypothetical protein H257_14686 [Aphanomyces astaci]|uniref:Uncharacterized protein n=1 Tax=Aphanomyces astaci TaxID=112090 RepID=W4FQA6_APHAT|nr:hypothetical protein H257_14686 [Aphanomyces astaci]ETV69662.1 hypothetical protein H257_14686 [Aphanomyces astaci]|eukprot:XP_009840878.1 hypothetical protein H257_14686 [Aphanomyces astaci]
MSPPPGTAGLMLRRTISSEMQYATTMSLLSRPLAGALRFAAYPPEITSVMLSAPRRDMPTSRWCTSTINDSCIRSSKMETNNRLMVVYDEQCRRQNVEQLHVKNKQTRSHEQGLHQATTASIKHGEQLEEMQLPAVAAPTTVPADAGVQVVYGFQEVPKAPSFNGSTKVQMRKFLDQYETYASEVNIAQRAPLSVCIDPLSVECIAYWEIGKLATG